MQIGIGLPATIPGAGPEVVLEWARRAETGPFSSVGIMDRLVYPNFEPLVTLAVVAGATRRIRLMAAVIVAPLRNAGILAKQAASLDALSGGRLTLGLGIGTRPDDFAAAPAELRHRARRFEEQLALMRRIWSGEPLAADIGPVGPPPARPGGPELLIGGDSPAAVRRAGRWGDGFLGGGGSPALIRDAYGIAEAAWRAEGRPGRPRLVAAAFYALGPGAADAAAAYLHHYYGYMGPRADVIARGALTSPEAVAGAIRAFVEIGADELLLRPCVAEIDQLERLAEVVGAERT
jgi:alkanesulfonate monooxygenase SsuD/methylene tetrahydromethanopterin reductase-like flavin-dependent oxidoreductase (luciferase family)